MAVRPTSRFSETPDMENIEYIVQGKYPGIHGWEDLTAHSTMQDAEHELAVYMANEPMYIHRVIARKKGDST